MSLKNSFCLLINGAPVNCLPFHVVDAMHAGHQVWLTPLPTGTHCPRASALHQEEHLIKMFNTALAFNTNFVSIKWSTSFPGSFFSAFLGRVGRKTKRGREERPWKRGCQIVNPHDWSLEVYQWIKLAVVNKTFQHFFSTLTLIDQHYHLFFSYHLTNVTKQMPNHSVANNWILRTSGTLW